MAVAPLSFQSYVPSRDIDFSPLANLGQVYKQAQQDATRQQTLAQLGQGDKIDPRILLSSGDMSLANLGVQIQNRQEDQARQGRLDARQLERDKVTDAQNAAYLGIAQRAANRADEDKFGIKDYTDANGNTQFVKFNPRTGEITPLNTGAVALSQPNNPFSAGGKFNGDQGKAAGFTDRMLQSEGILSGVNGQEGVQGQGTNLTQSSLAAVADSNYAPGVIGAAANWLKSENRQKYDQAKRDFVNAQLRRESGAAISPSEFASAEKQYFPTVGDSEAVIAQKAANRRSAIEAMGREGGPSYRPKYAFDENGRVAPYGRQSQAQQAGPAVPKVGELRDGYRFRGGNPADPSSWVKQQ